MSLRVDITFAELDLSALDGQLRDASGLHARIAGDAENFIKARGRQTSATEHRSANRLGATPTGHLADAYEAIEGVSDASAASLLVPRASRLRAAFGSYVLTPGPGRKFLTIPVNRAAYGKRAGEFTDLFALRAGPKKTLLLARDTGSGLEVMYVLAAKATMPADPDLIPIDDLTATAQDSAEAFLDEAIAATLNPATR